MATYLPFSDVVAAYGYRQPPPTRQQGNVVMLALAYLVMGTAMGTVTGAGLAMATFHSGIPPMVFQVASPVQANSTVDSAVTPPMQASVMTSRAVEVPAGLATPSPLQLTKASFQATHRPRHTYHPGALLKPVALSAVPTQIATLSHAPAAAPVLAAAVETEAKSYRFFSEGDATVADFDASMGRIETYEGRTFVIGTTAVASAGASLQDSGVSVHYRCDQSGSCTLVRAGMVMQNVRLL
jgi:hypothetical protein